MCNPISGFVNDKGDIRIAHPASHSGTQKILGLKLDLQETWSEFEWEPDQDLIVRHTSHSVAAARVAAIKERWQTRDELVEHCRPLYELHGNFLVETQEDADRLPTEVTGDLIWSPGCNKGVVIAAPQLQSIGGDAYFRSLTDASGLNALQSIGVDAYFDALTDAQCQDIMDQIAAEAEAKTPNNK